MLTVYLPIAAGLVFEGGLEDGAHDSLVFQGTQLEDARAGDEGGDHFEIGVLGGGADQDDGAVLHMWEQGVLLGLVPAVDFIDEQDRAGVVQAAAFEGLGDHLAQFGLAVEHGGEGDEVRLGDVGDYGRQGGLAGAGRPPQQD